MDKFWKASLEIFIQRKEGQLQAAKRMNRQDKIEEIEEELEELRKEYAEYND